MSKIFTYHENASGKVSFLRTGDAWNINNKYQIFAVANSPIRCLVKDSKTYPFDDYGLDASQAFCDSVVHAIENKVEVNSTFTKDDFLNSLGEANISIKKLNQRLGKKYNDELNYDLAETVGVAAVINQNKIVYGGIDGSYVFIIRGEEFEHIQSWEYQILKASKEIDKLKAFGKLESYIPTELKARLKEESYYEPYWCNIARNNYELKNEKGEKIGWGCFTGESEAEKFFQVHETQLEPGDHIFVISDGIIPHLNDAEFLK